MRVGLVVNQCEIHTGTHATLARNGKGQLVATAFPKQDSSMMAPLAKADCLIVRPPHAEPAPAGATVEVLPMPDGLIRL